MTDRIYKEMRQQWLINGIATTIGSWARWREQGLARQTEEEVAKDIITRIAQAIINGELDEWLKEMGLVGRAVWQKQGDEDHIYDWVADLIESGARTFIALCKEEEPGNE